MKTATVLKQEATYMPLKLKGVLARLGIRQNEWANAIKQEGRGVEGKPLSLSAATQIMNWGVWPKLTSAESIKRQTAELLRRHDVDEVDIAQVWEIEEDDHSRNAHPLNVHLGQQHARLQPEIEPLEIEMLSPNAKKHFGLFRDPFVEDVQGPEDVFLCAEQRYIREAMYSTAKHGGMLAVIGESGAGKTVLRRDLIDRVQRDTQLIVLIQPRLIDKGTMTAGGICEAIIGDLREGEKIPRSLEAKARKVEQLLKDSSRAGNVHSLLIEEAHDLSIQTLKFLKRFWELEDGFKKLLSIILIGQPELKNKLDERVHYEAREVIRRCEIAELMPLDGQLEEYLAMKFKRVGKNKLDELFDKSSFDAMRARLTRQKGAGKAVSMVYPLVVNNLVTNALNLAAEIGADKVSAEVIKEL
ncbi:MAG: AAA family ATPase [Gallionellaceae bacterium]|jgi:type II secretory pathway predicted ATPase ExeA